MVDMVAVYSTNPQPAVPDKSIPGRAGEIVVEQVLSDNPTRPLAEDTPHKSALRSTFFELGLLLQLSDFCNSATTALRIRVSRTDRRLKVFTGFLRIRML
jgi:hypothetical protein